MSDKKSRHLITFVVLFAMGGFMFMRGGCPLSQNGSQHHGGLPQGAKVEMITIDGWPLYVELADTPRLRRQGWSGREELLPGYGMLFVFDSPSKPVLMMQETPIEISAAFVDDNGQIKEMVDFVPETLKKAQSQTPVQYVLITRKGFFADHGIDPGAFIEMPDTIALR